MKIKCYTLFDITQTNVSNRRRGLEQTVDPDTEHKRRQQRNLETILQVLSLRSQPEDITEPVIDKLAKDTKFKNPKFSKDTKVWSFTFTVSTSAVYKKDEIQLGSLLEDCQSVPMITGLDENARPLFAHLDTEANIHFEVIDE
jgi:hypothetical protein